MFPVVPIQRLHERPTTESTIVDITCDSDGKISKFIDTQDVKDTLPLHPFDGSPYYLGIFLTGAYQDIMGDIHNLFGRVNEAHVFLDDDEDCGYYIEETISGNTILEVLAMTQWDTHELVGRLKAQVDAAIKQVSVTRSWPDRGRHAAHRRIRARSERSDVSLARSDVEVRCGARAMARARAAQEPATHAFVSG